MQTTVRCSTVVTARVTATGVAAGAARGHQQPGHVAGAVGGAEHHEGHPRVGVAAQSTPGSSMSTTRTSRALPPTSPAPAYAARR